MGGKARLHLRWWHWLLVVVVLLVVLLVTVVLAFRSLGEQRYAQVLMGLKTPGRPTTVDELIAMAPRVDEALQARWRRATDAAGNYPPPSLTRLAQEWDRFVCGVAPVPTDVLVHGDLHRSAMESALQALRDGNLVLGMAGAVQRIPAAGSRTLADITSNPVIDLLAARSVAAWLRHQACVSGDPTVALNDLERLLRSGEHPCSLLDAMTVIAVAEVRDETYRDLALLGRLPASLRHSWLAEASWHQEWMARGFDAERALFNDAWADSIRRMSWSTAAFTADPLNAGATEPWNPLHVFGGTWMWCTSVGDCAVLAEIEAHVAARLRRERTDPIPQDGVDRMWFVLGRITLPNLLISAGYGVNQIVSHRLNRLCIMLLEQSATGLPRDEQDLIARFGQVLDQGGDHLRLRYERLADDRFRLVVDPTTPVPNFLDAGMIPGWSRAFGRPASDRPLVSERGSIELQVPAILRPPAPAP